MELLTRKLTKEHLRQLIEHELAEARKRKPQCSRGNPYKDQMGRFTDPETDRGSFSLKKDKPYDPECRSGVARRPSSTRHQVTTQLGCGRGPDGKGKAPYKCKDGTRSHTPSPITEDELIQLLDEGDLDCSPCWDRFLKALNAAARAQKGKLFKEPG